MKKHAALKVLLAVLLMVFACVVAFQIVRPADEMVLDRYAHNIFSQDGEDGVIQTLFSVIEPTSKYAVEFGCHDGVSNSNVRNLFVNYGWSGFLIDGDPEVTPKAKAAYKDNPRVKVLQAWVYPGNVEILFEENGVPRDLDLLVIDIDSNDYYVWRAIHDFRPKVVLIEYNSGFPPPQKAVIDFHPMNYWEDGSDYFGASIQSLYELGKRKGYELVYASPRGLNLFFVDGKYFGRLGIRDNSPARIYRPPGYLSGRGGKPGNGRGPGGWGHNRYDTYEEIVDVDGTKAKPFAGPLIWEKLSIPKKFVAR